MSSDELGYMNMQLYVENLARGSPRGEVLGFQINSSGCPPKVSNAIKSKYGCSSIPGLNSITQLTVYEEQEQSQGHTSRSGESTEIRL